MIINKQLNKELCNVWPSLEFRERSALGLFAVICDEENNQYNV